MNTGGIRGNRTSTRWFRRWGRGRFRRAYPGRVTGSSSWWASVSEAGLRTFVFEVQGRCLKNWSRARSRRIACARSPSLWWS